jgi:Mce-associated membrane protein
MGDKSLGRGGEDVTTGVEPGETESPTATTADVRALLEQAEAEAAEAEAAAAAARARVREMRGEGREEGDDGREGEEEGEKEGSEEGATVSDDGPSLKPARLWSRIRRPQRSTIAKTVATLLIVSSVTGSGYILWHHHNSSARNNRAAGFAAAASRGITALTSLDFRRAKEDVQKIIDNSTGSFRDDYEVRADDFVKVVEASKVVARGTVTATAVQSMTDDEAVVLVAASEEITNSAGNKQPRAYRFRVTVTRDGDQFKLSKVELVP